MRSTRRRSASFTKGTERLKVSLMALLLGTAPAPYPSSPWQCDLGTRLECSREAGCLAVEAPLSIYIDLGFALYERCENDECPEIVIRPLRAGEVFSARSADGSIILNVAADMSAIESRITSRGTVISRGRCRILNEDRGFIYNQPANDGPRPRRHNP